MDAVQEASAVLEQLVEASAVLGSVVAVCEAQLEVFVAAVVLVFPLEE